MPKRQLNYRFHDPNPPETTAAYITRLFIEVNTGKVEAAIEDAAQAQSGACTPKSCREERSA